MASDRSGSVEDTDWRLQAELPAADGGMLRELVGRMRGPNVVEEIQATVPRDVVVTHDGSRLFAYAADEGTLSNARGAIEAILASDGLESSVRVSRWEEDVDQWVQTDPPLSPEELQAVQAQRSEAEEPQTRTLVVSFGREVRAQLEQTMREWAERLGVRCEIVEHPHLLTTQVAFTVTGPRGKLDEFASGLKAEERATIRTETDVMLSPL